MDNVTNALVEQMVYLIACALHDVTPDKGALEGLDLASLYSLANTQSLAAMICMALETTDIFESAAPEIVKRWKDAKDKVIRKNILLDAERAQILREMDKAGIWYLPLKGIVLQELYPKFGMRQMADNDILYDAAFRTQLKKFMLGRGYEAASLPENIAKHAHDAYEKPPIYNFEMHTALFGLSYNPAWTDYYADVKKRLVSDSTENHAFHFTDEDFYIYVSTHACKHYQEMGNGLRMLVDAYVLNWKKGSTWDWEYIHSELKELGIANFEEQIRLLAEKLFGSARPFSLTELSKPELEMLFYCIGSGTFGTIQNRVNNEMKKLHPVEKPITKRVKLRYYLYRLFPGREWCRAHYPFFYRHPLLLPFLWIYRIVHDVWIERKNILNEIRTIKNMGK